MSASPLPGESPVRIVPESREDYEAIRTVTAQAFSKHPEVADLVELIRRSPEYIRELSLVAMDADGVVGHLMISHVEVVDQRGEKHRAATLSPVSVAPHRQGRGIGSSLIRAALSRADALGEPIVILEGSPDYYPRFGFQPASEFGIQITLPDWAPPEAAMVYPLSCYGPTIRGKLEYPAAFKDTGTGH